MTRENAPAEVVNLDSAWDMAVEAGLDGCFPPDTTSFQGWEQFFDRKAEQCRGGLHGEARLDLVRRSTGKRELWSAELRRQDDPRLLGYGDPFVYVITGFSRVDE